jgi:hypothetical protein
MNIQIDIYMYIYLSGAALCLLVCTNNPNTGVKNKSNPAIKAHLEAEVKEIPHC